MAGNFFSQFLGPSQSRLVYHGSGGGGSQSSPAGGGAGLSSILQQLQGANTQYNTDANTQHADLMSMVRGMNDRVLGEGGLFSTLGQTGQRRIERNTAQSLAAGDQSAANRGLYNTTVLDSTRRGIKADGEEASQALAEGVATQRAGAEMQLGQLTGDFMLSKQLLPPDSAMYANLIQQIAANGGSLGGGGGTSGVLQRGPRAGTGRAV